jgi:hypothetical protein
LQHPQFHLSDLLFQIIALRHLYERLPLRVITNWHNGYAIRLILLEFQLLGANHQISVFAIVLWRGIYA